MLQDGLCARGYRFQNRSLGKKRDAMGAKAISLREAKAQGQTAGSFVDAVRTQKSFTARSERKALHWLVARIPQRIGFGGAIAACGMAAMFTASAFLHTRELYLQETRR
jgi:hypothetical protein